MDVERLRQNWIAVKGRIAEAAQRSGRSAEAVSLVAVTKTVGSEAVRALVSCGAVDLGENYPQELWRKHTALADLEPPVRWHLIGHLQTNKARRTFPLVRLIHAVDSLRLLHLLDELAAPLSPIDRPGVCLQVNTSSETSKHGWSPDDLIQDADAIAACQTIPVVGLMTMAAYGTSAETARPSFERLRRLRDEFRVRTGLTLPELSMGMSNDFEAAIEEGATLVRVGSALFEGVDP
jgi:pyridoxal phosphate enzyme (YggS family)